VQIFDERGTFLSDLDHVVIGPPGVVTINTKYHRRGTVHVDRDTVTVNGRHTSYIPAARREADRTRVILGSALAGGRPDLAAHLQVRPLIVVVGAVPRITGEPTVPVIALQRLHATVETMPARLDPDQVDAVFQVAHTQDVWTLPTTRR
jgi:hypothetical protein